MSVFHGHPFFDFALHDSIKPFAFDVMMDDSPVPHAYDDGIDCMNQPEKRQESIQPKKENESGEGCFHGDEQKCTEAKRRNWTVKEGKNVSGKKTKVTVKTREKGDDKSGKGYIHVRARRGQATDSHSLAERVRREKISERMKTLQTLVPGCDKVTSKALMLDEIINYVQSLQNQVEFLSMKLASMNPTVYHFTNGSDCSELKPQSMSAPQPALQSDGFSVAVDSTAFHISNDLFDFPFVNTSDYSLLLPDHGQNLAPQMIESQSNRFIDQASFMGLFQ